MSYTPRSGRGRETGEMSDQFREVEAAFGCLKDHFNQGKISQREFIDSLKQLRIKDGSGRFWMIGAQSGQWYYFDGNGWVQAKPPSASERKAICIYCGYENDLEAETCARCGSGRAGKDEPRACPKCGTRLDDPEAPCPVCQPDAGRASAAAAVVSEEAPRPPAERGLVIRAVHPASFFWFFGVLGVFVGMLAGLLVGVTGLFPRLVSSLPGFLADIQGKLLGGVVFTISGGLLGFVGAGPLGFLAAAVSNGVLSLVGGLRVRAVAAAEEPPDARSQG
jgi:hypothetical protein